MKMKTEEAKNSQEIMDLFCNDSACAEEAEDLHLKEAAEIEAMLQESFRRERDAWAITRAELLAKKNAVEKRSGLIEDEIKKKEIQLVNVIQNSKIPKIL